MDINAGKSTKKASYLRILSDYRVILTFLTTFIPLTVYTLMGPTYSLYLKESLDVGPSESGYIMGLGSLSYAIFCPITGKLA